MRGICDYKECSKPATKSVWHFGSNVPTELCDADTEWYVPTMEDWPDNPSGPIECVTPINFTKESN